MLHSTQHFLNSKKIDPEKYKGFPCHSGSTDELMDIRISIFIEEIFSINIFNLVKHMVMQLNLIFVLMFTAQKKAKSYHTVFGFSHGLHQGSKHEAMKAQSHIADPHGCLKRNCC